MGAVLQYGLASEVDLEFSPDVLVADCAAPRGEPVSDPAVAIRAALAAPLSYPALTDAMVPGDRVAIVLGDEVPQAAQLVAGAVKALLAAGVEPEHFVIVQPPSAHRTPSDPRTELEPDLAAAIGWEVHDPADPQKLCFLGAASDTSAVYLNRAICEADFVLPIGLMRLKQARDYRGFYANLFPTFSDEATLERYRGLKFLRSRAERKRRRKETDDMGWLLGARMVVQIIPGAGDAVQQVLAGDVEAVMAESQRLGAATWSYEVPRRAQLVVAAVTGDAEHQTWENVARALEAAKQVVTDEGAVAICTDLAIGPGPAIMHLAEYEDLDLSVEQIRGERSPDALPAWRLAQALHRGPVYLLSQLDEGLVESLGIAPIEEADTLRRLTRRFESCIVLPHAQYVQPRVADALEE